MEDSIWALGWSKHCTNTNKIIICPTLSEGMKPELAHLQKGGVTSLRKKGDRGKGQEVNDMQPCRQTKQISKILLVTPAAEAACRRVEQAARGREWDGSCLSLGFCGRDSGNSYKENIWGASLGGSVHYHHGGSMAAHRQTRLVLEE